jgi:hypothetical protein
MKKNISPFFKLNTERIMPITTIIIDIMDKFLTLIKYAATVPKIEIKYNIFSDLFNDMIRS